jgi:hypothetical protein
MTSFGVTDRGLRHYDPIPTDYGHEVRIYESSSAEAPHLWLSVELTPEGGQHGLLPQEATAHLTLDQARAIRDALDAAIDGHYQLR